MRMNVLTTEPDTVEDSTERVSSIHRKRGRGGGGGGGAVAAALSRLTTQKKKKQKGGQSLDW